MLTRTKLVLVALTATALLGIAVGTASARNLEILNWEKGFRIAWTSLEFSAGTEVVRCPVTLEGSFHRHTFAKVAGSLIGYVTSAIVGTPCTGGTARVLAERLPFHVQFDSFGGTLPIITTIKLRLVGAAFAIHPTRAGITCLARTEAGEPAIGIANLTTEGGGLQQVNSVTAEASTEIGLEGFFCSFAGAGHFSGTGSATVQNGTEKIRIKLIQ